MYDEFNITDRLAVIVNEDASEEITAYDRSVVRILCYFIQMGPTVVFDNEYISDFLTAFEGDWAEYNEGTVASSLGKLKYHRIIEIEFSLNSKGIVTREISLTERIREYNYQVA